MSDQNVPIIERYSERKLIMATHRSWNNCMKIFAKYPKVEYRATPQYTLLNSGTKIGMLNRVMNTNLTDVEADKTIEEVKNFYKSKDFRV